MFLKPHRKFLILFFIFIGCKNTTLLVGEANVPFEKICGSQAKYKCEATGEAPMNLPANRNYLKQRPDGSGKSGLFGYNYYNLGLTVDNTAFHNPIQTVIDLRENDIEKVDTVLIDYDLKEENMSDIISELGATLKKKNVDLEVSAKILNEFKRELDNSLIIEGKIITFTIKPHIKRGILDAKAGISTDERYLNAYKRLTSNGYPFVRQVKVIEEKCKFIENKTLSNILNSVLTANLSRSIDVNSIIDLTLSKKKSSTFSSSYNLTTIYSYGYWFQSWMM